MSAPSDWHIEVRAKGGAALTPAVTLTSPSFIAPATERLNTPPQFSFTLGQFDPQALKCDPSLGREIRLYRGASWAAATWKQAYRIWTRDVNDRHEAVFGCFGLLDYFRDRYIDRGSERANLLLNGDFEDLSGGIPNWAATSTTPTLISTDHVDGTHSVQLVQAADNAAAYLEQDVSVTAIDTAGDVLTLAAWFKVVSWTGPALANFGLGLYVEDGSHVPVSILGQPQGQSSADINWLTQRGVWLKLETTAYVPYGAAYTAKVRLFSPNGTILWDAVFLGRYESLSVLQTDQATIAADISNFLQDTTKGKDDVSITTAGSATGVKRDRTYQYADHVNGLQAVTEFTTLTDGMDIAVLPDRTFTTYAISSGGIGTDKTTGGGAVTLTVGTNCEISSHKFDGPSAASDVTTLGDGSGPGREEGGARDATKFGGVTVQQVLSSPSVDTRVDSLGPWAAKELGLFGDPTSMVLIVTDRELGFGLSMGDRVDVSANQGCVQESGHARVVGLSADLRRDLMSVTLNRVP